MKKLLIRVTGTLVLLLVAAFVYVQVTLFRAGGGLPQWDGELQIAGVQSQVVIQRDEFGIPHITVSNEADLYFAQGFVHAQDRFWQMALARQSTLGRLSEWYGSSTLTNDRIQRMWGWEATAKTGYESLSDADNKLIDAYADGVNAWLGSEYYRRPPEMRILHIHPEPWSPTDSFVLTYSLFQILATFGTELDHARVRAAGAPDDTIEILNPIIQATPPIIAAPEGVITHQQSMPEKRNAYSDNWTLSGEHTASGLPIMANDPQLPIALPGTWQLHSIKLGERLLAGGTLPGNPGIVVGHNGSVAWGITTAPVDVADFAFLEQDPEDTTRYRRGPSSDWMSYRQHTETIKVRFGSDHTETVRRTNKGVVWPAGLRTSFTDGSAEKALEIRAVPLDVPGQNPMAFIRLNRANNVEQGIEALRDLTALALNLSLADVDGNIGYVTTGRVALREESHATTVEYFPDDDNDWEIASYEANPKIINPPNGRIVTANQKIVGDDYPHYLSDYWSAPYRAWRIHEALDEKKLHDTDTFHAMQMDTLSPVARQLSPLMLKVQPADDADRALLAILEAWDYRFTLDSEAATIWSVWTSLLRREIVADELGPIPALDYGSLFASVAQALNVEKAHWCDNRETETVEDCAQALSTSLTATRLVLEESFGSEPNGWQWGQVTRFRLAHQGLDSLPFVGSRFSRETPLQGGPESMFINAILPEEAPAFTTSIFSSSYQGIYDLSDLENSLFMVAGGTSGHFKSPHYNDLTERWVKGERMTLDGDVESSIAVLRISPVTP